MKASRRLFSLMLIAMVLLLAACGQNEEKANNGAQAGNTTETGSTDTAQTAETTETADAAGPIKVQTSKGEIELPAAAQRIVTIEWTYTEDLLALGVQPVGHADIENYKKWVNIPVELSADVVDVGTRQEPNLETISSLKPDLIITDENRAGQNLEQLQAIAPVLVFNSYPGENEVDQFTQMENSFKEIAKAVGKEAEAEQVLKKMNETFAQAAEKLKAAGKEGAPIAMTQAFSADGVPSLRMFTDNSSAIQIMTKIGLKNVWTSEQFEMYGFSNATVEALPKVQDANFLYIVQDDDNVFATTLKDNPVWTGLNFVKENRAYALGGDSWPFGGPLSAEVFATKTADLLSK